MRKKLMALLLAASMVVGMTACGSNKNGGSSTNSASKVSGEYDEKEFNGIKYKKAKDKEKYLRGNESIITLIRTRLFSTLQTVSKKSIQTSKYM